ncbi:hypothetical protein AR158_c001R [Paramecium bursaria Chlorella virus AR158]|uniref:hypothetical protein n=1 Tax=Paramecium bursaria Chlorella virus AR158 TaxID=380598 RepID=UPI00015AA6F0|nr:hypothetical protein AR158_c001R [Paramecium bursaria Chlorella virus AR158]ABU43547.1 hypothetical protein AR158_c001R [Paramecium bursaria Chlorella virus AR158]
MVYGKSLRSPRCHLLSERYPSLIRQITKVASVSSAIGTLSEPSLVWQITKVAPVSSATSRSTPEPSCGMYKLEVNSSIQHMTLFSNIFWFRTESYFLHGLISLVSTNYSFEVHVILW